MSVEGSISVVVDFNDTADGDSVDTLKKIRLATNNAYTAGKIAVIAGTVGANQSAFVWAATAASSYVDASGEAVQISSVSEVAVYSPAKCLLFGSPSSTAPSIVADGKVALSACPGTPETLSVQSAKGVVPYTVVIWSNPANPL